MRVTEAVKETIADFSSVSRSLWRWANALETSVIVFHGVHYPHQHTDDTPLKLQFFVLHILNFANMYQMKIFVICYYGDAHHANYGEHSYFHHFRQCAHCVTSFRCTCRRRSFAWVTRSCGGWACSPCRLTSACWPSTCSGAGGAYAISLKVGCSARADPRAKTRTRVSHTSHGMLRERSRAPFYKSRMDVCRFLCFYW